MPRPLLFCGSCGTPLGLSDHQGGAECPACHRSWYPIYAPTAGCALVLEGKVLLTKRAIDPERGRWDVPGGFLAAGEALVDGVTREIREELGIEIRVTFSDLLQVVPHPYGPEGDWVLSHGFVARSFRGEPSMVEEIDEIRWVDADGLERLDFAWEHDRELARKALVPTNKGDGHGSG